MNAICLSGTGNTRHIVTLLLNELGAGGISIPIESADAIKALEGDELILAYPTMFSNIPYLVRDYINKNQNVWKGKKVFLITTMGLFAGDGTGCAARLLKKYGGISRKDRRAMLLYCNEKVYGDKVIYVDHLECQGVVSHVIKKK